MFLDRDLFRSIVSSTPLISLDLIVSDGGGRFLLGRRNNRPAQGFWFVPGGRVLKGEALDVAFSRLCSEELSLSFSRELSDFDGVYEHMYPDSIFGDQLSTHYVVLAYRLLIDGLSVLPKEQHCEYRWFSVDEILSSSAVHDYTKSYFLCDREGAPNFV